MKLELRNVVINLENEKEIQRFKDMGYEEVIEETKEKDSDKEKLKSEEE